MGKIFSNFKIRLDGEIWRRGNFLRSVKGDEAPRTAYFKNEKSISI